MASRAADVIDAQLAREQLALTSFTQTFAMAPAPDQFFGMKPMARKVVLPRRALPRPGEGSDEAERGRGQVILRRTIPHRDLQKTSRNSLGFVTRQLRLVGETASRARALRYGRAAMAAVASSINSRLCGARSVSAASRASHAGLGQRAVLARNLATMRASLAGTAWPTFRRDGGAPLASRCNLHAGHRSPAPSAASASQWMRVASARTVAALLDGRRARANVFEIDPALDQRGGTTMKGRLAIASKVVARRDLDVARLADDRHGPGAYITQRIEEMFSAASVACGVSSRSASAASI